MTVMAKKAELNVKEFYPLGGTLDHFVISKPIIRACIFTVFPLHKVLNIL